MTIFDRFRRVKTPPLHVAIDEGTGPVVVLVHGIASSSVTFENLIPLITDRHRVIAVDLLGFGESLAPESATFTIEEHVEALEDTLDALRLRHPFVLVGHSMGSLIASRYAATNRKRVSKLVLVSPPVYMNPEALGDPVERAAMGLYLKAYEFLRTNQNFTMRNAAMLARISPIKNVLEVNARNWKAFVLSLQNSIESQTTVSDIASVTVPVEIIYGALDPFLMPGGLRIVEQMRLVTVHKVDASDHLVRKRLARVVAVAIG
ncbi:alpha/beta fold hydrolase [Marisediminicola antarctica]|uniref:Esterase n=1 Tax=Marisediminicola antarctica TaxID=674079 RepID=A0A7L5AEM9_9MICO|nr:alpha/beta hydrolase [Marisediminicola antarctica]QHO68853.1 esterase [Marisediminicola antarctica]